MGRGTEERHRQKQGVMEFREQIIIGFVFCIFAYFLSLGFWQVLGTFRGIRAFSLLPADAEKRWGYPLGFAIMAVASAWFFGTRTEDIFCPGPASSEFLFFLSVALFSALQTCLAVSSMEDRFYSDALRAGPRRHRRRDMASAQWWQRAL